MVQASSYWRLLFVSLVIGGFLSTNFATAAKQSELPVDTIPNEFFLDIHHLGYEEKIQALFESHKSPLATYSKLNTTLGINRSAAEIIQNASDHSNWRVNPEILITLLQWRWNLLDSTSFSIAEIDAIVHFSDTVPDDFESQVYWVAEYLFNQSISTDDKRYSKRVEDDRESSFNVLSAMTKDLFKENTKSVSAFIDAYNSLFINLPDQGAKESIQTVMSVESESSVILNPPLPSLQVNSYLDHGTFGDGSVTILDGRTLSGTLTNCTLKFSCYDKHTGTDYQARSQSILAAAHGTISVSSDTGYECSKIHKKVQIQHPDSANYKYETKYWHLSEIGINPRTGVKWQVGDDIEQGESVGTSGNTGCSDGEHLHFEVRNSSDTLVDPYGWWGDGSYQSIYTTAGVVVSEDGSGFAKFGDLGHFQSGDGDGGHSYYFYSVAGNYEDWAQWWADIPVSGMYEIKAYVPPPGIGTNVEYKIMHRDGITSKIIQQIRNPDDPWISLGSYAFDAHGTAMVMLSDYSPDGVAGQEIDFDTIKWEGDGITPPPPPPVILDDLVLHFSIDPGEHIARKTVTTESTTIWPLTYSAVVDSEDTVILTAGQSIKLKDRTWIKPRADGTSFTARIDPSLGE